jgi:hypothetical protein
MKAAAVLRHPCNCVLDSHSDHISWTSTYTGKPASLPSKKFINMASNNTEHSEKSRCLVCKTNVPKNPRYPSYVCWTCHGKARDAFGRELTLHTSMDGDFEARYKFNGIIAFEAMQSHTVFIGAFRLWAKVDKHVGVVLTPYRGADEPHNRCPVCHSLRELSPRYPDFLCGRCGNRAVDPKGRRVTFCNTHIGGGFMAKFVDDSSEASEITESHICYVGHLKVWADEARFGGIVLVPYKREVDWVAYPS